MLLNPFERFTLVLRCGDGGGAGSGSGGDSNAAGDNSADAVGNANQGTEASAAAVGAPGVGGVAAGAAETGGAVGSVGGGPDTGSVGGGGESLTSAIGMPAVQRNTEAATPGNNTTATKTTRKARKGASFDNAIMGVPGLLGVRSNSLF